jgi:chromosome segregation ATPase
MPADDARSEGFFGEKAVTKGRVRCFSTWSEQRAKAERLLGMIENNSGEGLIDSIIGRILTNKSVGSMIAQKVSEQLKERDAKVDEIQASLVQLNIAVAELTSVSKSQGETLSKQGETLSMQVEALRDQGVTLSKQVDTLREHGETLRDQGVTLSKQVDTLREHGETLRDQGVTLSKQVDTLREHGETLNMQGETLREQGQVIKEMLSELQNHSKKTDVNTRSIRAIGRELSAGKKDLNKDLRRVVFEAANQSVLTLAAAITLIMLGSAGASWIFAQVKLSTERSNTQLTQPAAVPSAPGVPTK